MCPTHTCTISIYHHTSISVHYNERALHTCIRDSHSTRKYIIHAHKHTCRQQSRKSTRTPLHSSGLDSTGGLCNAVSTIALMLLNRTLFAFRSLLFVIDDDDDGDDGDIAVAGGVRAIAVRA